jgi:hypothetical protein
LAHVAEIVEDLFQDVFIFEIAGLRYPIGCLFLIFYFLLAHRANSLDRGWLRQTRDHLLLIAAAIGADVAFAPFALMLPLEEHAKGLLAYLTAYFDLNWLLSRCLPSNLS